MNGYTREILERDGSPPAEVDREFRAYAGELPVVAYHLEYDWDKVLVPEWQRLGIPPIGGRGWCALKLAQRLLDPVPAGNCKLQTLRQFYRLSERGAHTALGDVETVIDLMQQVLRPLAEQRGLATILAILPTPPGRPSVTSGPVTPATQLPFFCLGAQRPSVSPPPPDHHPGKIRHRRRPGLALRPAWGIIRPV